ncbi:hypothetical protein BCS42_14720 [Crenothrix sp. D3]|jgi:uncharacterized membrane protein YwaF|nr:hypothetical protein BCS42_14720 [Crenothrix sp. D3]
MFLAKILAIAVVALFYTTAKKKGESPVNWAVIGFIGYVIVWGLVYTLINKFLGTGSFVIMQIPALCAMAVAFLIRQKLISNAAGKNS